MWGLSWFLDVKYDTNMAQNVGPLLAPEDTKYDSKWEALLTPENAKYYINMIRNVRPLLAPENTKI